MALTAKHFDRLCLPRVAIIVGSLHILGSLSIIIGTTYVFFTPQHSVYSEADNYGDVISISVASIFALAGCLLIIGTYKKSHLMFLPWLVLEAISLSLYFVWNAMSLILSYDYTLGNTAIAMVYFSIIGLCVYVWFAILSFYQIIRDEKEKLIQDDEEKLCAQPNTILHVRGQKPYPPPYVIPITYSNIKQPASQIKY